MGEFSRVKELTSEILGLHRCIWKGKSLSGMVTWNFTKFYRNFAQFRDSIFPDVELEYLRRHRVVPVWCISSVAVSLPIPDPTDLSVHVRILLPQRRYLWHSALLREVGQHPKIINDHDWSTMIADEQPWTAMNNSYQIMLWFSRESLDHSWTTMSLSESWSVMDHHASWTMNDHEWSWFMHATSWPGDPAGKHWIDSCMELPQVTKIEISY